MNGAALTAEESAQLAAGFALPSFLVGSAGAVVDIVGMEDLIAQLEAASPESGVEITPAFIALLEESVTSKYWDAWAGFGARGARSSPRASSARASSWWW